MKFANKKNKKTKTYLKFDEDDRKDYLLGFRKRKLERKEKAKLEIVELKKKEKREIKKKRLELVQEMMDGQDSDSDSDDNNDYVSFSSLKTIDSVTQVCGESTVQVAGLSLESKMHIGANSTEQNVPLNREGRKKLKSTFKLKLPSSGLSNKILKSAIWKSATKDAVKNFKAEKRKKKQKKKKVMVTEL